MGVRYLKQAEKFHQTLSLRRVGGGVTENFGMRPPRGDECPPGETKRGYWRAILAAG